MAAPALKKLATFLKAEAQAESPVSAPSEERRVQPRFTTQFRSTFSKDQQEGQGRTLDLSIGGCKIESETGAMQGAKFECRLHIPDLDWPLRIDEATVRWVEGKTFGLAFTRMRPEEKTKLKQLLERLEEE
ncbi:MAG: PilZ domain-containing protein [Nitrospira sp.]|jgi:c-di-GMP-binding flagellar brake protein YcgR|nr:PilZ domain-containing protein [Nitrospira sp.]